MLLSKKPVVAVASSVLDGGEDECFVMNAAYQGYA
jgi:hypothetical protein